MSPSPMLDFLERTRGDFAFQKQLSYPREIMPETESPRSTLPATPSAIAAELEPIIMRATEAAFAMVIQRVEHRLTKIDHHLQLAQKHDAMMLEELMALKLRLDRHEERIGKIEARLVLKGMTPAPRVATRRVKRKKK